MATHVLGFTGTQGDMTREQMARVHALIRGFRGLDFHHGKCIGADWEAWRIAKNCNLFTYAHPSILKDKTSNTEDYVTYEPLPPLVRNREIVKAATEMIATPREYTEQMRSGTWATIRYARRAKVPIIIVYPNGESRLG